MADQTLTNIYNPDVLNCLANLSNDEVFTPPSLVNEMLNLLPASLWGDPNAKFLDPACKSGVFLREIAKRLLVGLEEEIPDLQQRIDHIFQTQLYGIAITELTSLLSRRSLYCSKYPNGRYSISPFTNADGNILFHRIEHRWRNGRCRFCGASQKEYDRGPELESHAYEFIHIRIPKELFEMKFDVVIGNPPYHIDTEGAGKQAKPIYHLFVQQAKKLNPRFLVMITPSRWLSGGMGLDNYRRDMLNNHQLSRVVDFSLSTDCFPGVDIAGGVSYFLWNRDYSGRCSYTFIDKGVTTTKNRDLDKYDVLVRNNKAIDIVEKVTAVGEKSISTMMSSLGPFGLGTAERGQERASNNSYILRSSAGKTYIDKHKVKTGLKYIDSWKVIIGKATSAGAATANKDGLRKVIATLEVLEPGAVCTFSYFIAGTFDKKQDAENMKSYISTKFVRFLLLQTLSSINITKDRFVFVPIQNFSTPWTDIELYAKYKLTEDEIAFIESMIRPMDLSNGVTQDD